MGKQMDDGKQTARELLIGCLRTALRNERRTVPDGCSWDKLIQLAKAQRVENLLWYALNGQEMVPEDVALQLQMAHHRAVFHGAQVEAWSRRIQTACKEHCIECVPLRGIVLRKSYPSPDMRPMADVDYLVHTKDYGTIQQILELMGGRHVHTDGGHFTFVVPPGLHVEFHPNLIYVMSPVGTEINPGWQYVHHGDLTAVGSYLNHICHAASDLTRGGAGVRLAMDNWVYRHKIEEPMDWEKIYQQLRQFGLLDFTCNLEALADWWFGNGMETPLLRELGDYLLNSGAHGTVQQAVLAQSARWGTAGGLVRKVFYPMSELCGRYPWLEGRPYLLPLAWVKRGIHALENHGEQVREWLSQSRQIRPDLYRAYRQQMKRFGLPLVKDAFLPPMEEKTGGEPGSDE